MPEFRLLANIFGREVHVRNVIEFQTCDDGSIEAWVNAGGVTFICPIADLHIESRKMTV